MTGHSEDMLDEIQMRKMGNWKCEDYPDNCDGQDPECKRNDCPWFAYITIHDGPIHNSPTKEPT